MMKKISKARVGIITKSDLMFFHPLLMRFPCSLDTSVPTASTNGREIRFNPDFIEPLSLEELQGLILHELFHALLHHIDRTKTQKLEPRKANVAGDYAINWILTNDFRMKIPKGGLVDQQYAGMTMEQIYALLPDNPSNELEDFDLSGDSLTEDEIQELETAIVSAAISAQMSGKLPKSLERFATARAAKVSWAAVLQAQLQGLGMDDYNLMKPAHALWNGGRGIYTPSMVSHRAGHIVVAVDTSGSVGEQELAQYLGEITGIMEDVRPDKITLIACDSRIHEVHTLGCDDLPLSCSLSGGGGTSFVPVFSYASELESVQALVYLTDMYGDFPRNAPPFPVFWCSTGGTTAPFGTVINVN